MHRRNVYCCDVQVGDCEKYYLPFQRRGRVLKRKTDDSDIKLALVELKTIQRRR